MKTSNLATVFVMAMTAVLASLMLIYPRETFADGGFVVPPESFMYEPGQQAYIHYDGETETEELSILPSFRGDASSFAWIVPVPSLPEVALADVQLFRDLDFLTRAEYRSRDGDWDCFQRESVYSPDGADGGFEVISSELVGYYQTLILSATEAPALLEFLTELGFLHDENQESVTEVITDYVERSWYFVAMQVDSTALDQIMPPYYYGYYSGRLDPIQLTFSSDEIIYPMKISALSADSDSRVRLYVNTDHRVTFSGASTSYANRFSPGELDEIPSFLSRTGVFQPGDFLTKLERSYRPEQMTTDLILVRAANDDEFHLLLYSGFPWTGILLLTLPLAAAVKRRFWAGGG